MLNIYDNYVFIIAINDGGKKIVDQISEKDISFFKKTTTYLKWHSSEKIYLDKNNYSNFEIKIGDNDSAVAILVYDLDDYELSKVVEDNIKGKGIHIVSICINDKNEIKYKNVINTKSKDARELILDILIPSFNNPGLITFDMDDYDRFMRNNYYYNSFIVKAHNFDDVINNTVDRLDSIDGEAEIMIFLIAKKIAMSAIEYLVNKRMPSLIYAYQIDDLEKDRILAVYKTE